MLYFKYLCFGWAAIGIGSRVAMAMMQENWNTWEENKAYKEQRPMWVVVVAVVGFLLIGMTWWVYLTQRVPYGWVLAVLVTLTSVKISTLLFQYEKFRVFLKETLANKSKMRSLNISVIVLSIALILMGLFLY